jgi:hypothetical protein
MASPFDNQAIAAAAAKRADWRNPGKVSPFGMELAKPVVMGPEHNLWFHSPSRFGAQFAPEDFRRKLKDYCEDLEVVWNFTIERWCLWVKTPRIQNEYAQGWTLLFVHKDDDGSYLPLDERIFARIYTIDMQAQNTDALRYFDRVMSEMQRDEQKAKDYTSGENLDIAMESFEHSKIRVGYGKNNGSKFSTYHA